MMKIIHIISGISRNSGGPSRSSQGLVAALNAAGVETWLLSCHPGEEPWLPGVTHFRAPAESRLKALRRFFEETLREVKPDLVHLHGIWAPQIHVAAKAAQKLGIPYIQSPRGMLDPWAMAQKRWKKRIAWWLYQRCDLKHACAFHVTAQAEADHVRGRGFRQPIWVVPNGVAVPEVLPGRPPASDVKTALFLSRLHPGKGLMTLAEAWGRVRPTGWRMRVVGFDGYGERTRVEARLKTLGILQDWTFEEPLDDVRKWEAFRSADLFLHPSVSENFGISIAEALYAGLPTIATTGAPWRELQTHRCGWWIEPNSVEALTGALREAFALSDAERAVMGERAHALIEQNYLWPVIGRRMAEAYRTVL